MFLPICPKVLSNFVAVFSRILRATFCVSGLELNFLSFYSLIHDLQHITQTHLKLSQQNHLHPNAKPLGKNNPINL